VRKARNKSTNGGRQPIWNQSAFNLDDFQINGQDITIFSLESPQIKIFHYFTSFLLDYQVSNEFSCSL